MTLTFGCVCGLVVLLAAACSSEGSDASSCGGRAGALVLLDIADYCMSKAKDMYPTCSEDDASFTPSGCGRKEMSQSYLEKAKELISKCEEKYPKFTGKGTKSEEIYSRWKLPTDEIYTTEADENSESKQTTFSLLDTTAQPMDTTTAAEVATELRPILPRRSRFRPFDCTDTLEPGWEKYADLSWLYGKHDSNMSCDTKTDGGGWTVIQRRLGFSSQVNFYRDWNSYKTGFGNVSFDFWFGNENIHFLTSRSDYEVRFDLQDENGDHRYAVYDSFWIDGESSDYTLHIGGYNGTAGDSMKYHDGQPFSTKDSNDNKCAIERRGGWWYRSCATANLNGIYQPGVEGKMGITWKTWHDNVSLAGSEIKIRRKIRHRA